MGHHVIPPIAQRKRRRISSAPAIRIRDVSSAGSLLRNARSLSYWYGRKHRNVRRRPEPHQPRAKVGAIDLNRPGYGRGGGVGRALGVGEGLGVEAGVAVGVAVVVAVGVAVGVAVDVEAGVAVGVGVGVMVGQVSVYCWLSFVGVPGAELPATA